MNVYLDIETIPDQSPGAMQEAAGRVKAPKHYKPETAAKYIQEHAAEAYHATGLDGTYGQIFCISFAVDDGEIITVQDDDERELLLSWGAKMIGEMGYEAAKRRPMYIGHNVAWDLRFLFHRHVITCVQPSVAIPYNFTPWSEAYYDTMYAWCGAKGTISLKRLAAVLGIKGHEDIDGSEVWDAVQAGRGAQVVAHCEADVARVREIHARLTFR